MSLRSSDYNQVVTWTAFLRCFQQWVMFNAKYEKGIFGCERPKKIVNEVNDFQKDVKWAQHFYIIMHDIVFIKLKAYKSIWSKVKSCLVRWLGTEQWHLADSTWKTDLEVSQVEKSIQSFPFELLTCLKPRTNIVFEIFQEGNFSCLSWPAVM